MKRVRIQKVTNKNLSDLYTILKLSPSEVFNVIIKKLHGQFLFVAVGELLIIAMQLSSCR